MPNLDLVAGAVVMEPRVTGPAVDLGRVGRRPLGQPATILRGNANYGLPFLPGLSVDAALSYNGRRPSSRDNLVSLDSYVLLDLGARYQFKLGKSPATLRLQMQNVTNSYAYQILGSNTYVLMDKRRINLFLAADF
jgi:iron complex outermembrane receptor protein